MGCDPKCYTKGLGCVVSADGRCVFLFAKEGEPKYTLNNKNILKNYVKTLDDYIKENSFASNRDKKS